MRIRSRCGTSGASTSRMVAGRTTFTALAGSETPGPCALSPRAFTLIFCGSRCHSDAAIPGPYSWLCWCSPRRPTPEGSSTSFITSMKGGSEDDTNDSSDPPYQPTRGGDWTRLLRSRPAGALVARWTAPLSHLADGIWQLDAAALHQRDSFE